MSYKPAEHELMAYLFDELNGEERVRVERYLKANPEADAELQRLREVSSLLKTVSDKEVIAPPLFLGDPAVPSFWRSTYFKTVVSIAASLVVVILVGKITDTRFAIKDNEVRLSFGDAAPAVEPPQNSLTTEEIQNMINTSLNKNNEVLNSSWQDSQVKLAQSISKNLVVNSDKMNEVVRKASSASKQQIQEYVSTLQSENMKLVKDYFTLTSSEQKQYIEGLLVDFAKYLQQQRKDDLQLVQLRLNSIEKNNTAFKQETEQILSSIINNVGPSAPSETKY